VCAAWSLCGAKRLFHLRPQIDLVLSAAKSALGPSRHLLRLHKGGRYRSEADIGEDL
jgi:hypothetical protein